MAMHAVQPKRSPMILRRSVMLPTVFALLGILGGCTNHAKLRESEIAQIETWFPGEYHNAEQVAADMASGVAQIHEPIDLVLVPISSMMIGKVVFYEEQSDRMNPRRILQQRLHRFEASADDRSIVHTILVFRQPERWTGGHRRSDIFKGLFPADVAAAACPLTWKFENGRFLGSSAEESCHGGAGDSGPGVRFELTSTELLISPRGLDPTGTRVSGHREDPYFRFRKAGSGGG